MAYHYDKPNKPFGEAMVEMMVRVFIMAGVLLFVIPKIIVPALGITPEEYLANELTWTLVSLVLGYIIAIPITRLTTRSIKGSG